MRLVDISEFFSDFGGGVRTYAHQKLDAAAGAGVKLTIIAPGPADRRETRLGGEIIWVRSPNLPFDHRYHLFADMRPVHALLDELAPDFVEASSTWRGAWMAAKWRGDAARALFLHQDPVAVYPHTFLSPALNEDLVDRLCFWFWCYLRNLAQDFELTVAPGRHFADRLKKFGVPRVNAIPLGVDHAAFSHEQRDETLRLKMLNECGVPHADAVLFIAVSRHHPEKRLPLLMSAFSKAAFDKPAALYIVGDGPMWKSVRSRGSRTPRVSVAGPITDRRALAQRFASADYFVHGGAAETFGLVVAEALCSGLPVITPHIGGAAELSHPSYSEAFRSGDADALAEAMMRAVARDRGAMSTAARAGGRRISSPAQHFDHLFQLYESRISSARRREAA